MVFTTFRSAVAELMEWLGAVTGVRATRFIGQSSAGKLEHEKGMAQKEQRDVVKRAHARAQALTSGCSAAAWLVERARALLCAQASVRASSTCSWPHRLARRASTSARST